MVHCLVREAAAAAKWCNLGVYSVQMGIELGMSSPELEDCALLSSGEVVDWVMRIWFTHFLVHGATSLTCRPVCQPNFFEIIL